MTSELKPIRTLNARRVVHHFGRMSSLFSLRIDWSLTFPPSNLCSNITYVGVIRVQIRMTACHTARQSPRAQIEFEGTHLNARNQLQTRLLRECSDGLATVDWSLGDRCV